MPRPKRDGTKPKPAFKRNLTELLVRKVKANGAALNVWDAKERGLVLRVQPSGHRAFKFVYSHLGRPRWLHIGSIYLSEARKIAAEVRCDVARGRDPVADRAAQRGAGTFADLANRYLEHAKRKNKSWEQASLPGAEAPHPAVGAPRRQVNNPLRRARLKQTCYAHVEFFRL